MLTFPKIEQKPAWQMLQCNNCSATGPYGDSEESVRIKWDIRANAA